MDKEEIGNESFEYAKKHGILSEIYDDLKLLMKVITGEIPATAKLVAMATAALVYLISPIDFVPDFTPIIGLLDDIAAISTAVASILKFLEKKKESKETE